MRAPSNCSAPQTIGTRGGGFRIAGLSGAFRIERRPGGQQIAFIPSPKLAPIGQGSRAAGAEPRFSAGRGRGAVLWGSPPSCARSRSPTALSLCGCCRTAPPAPAARTNDTAPGTAAAQHNVHFWCFGVFWGVFWCFLIFFFHFFFQGNQVQRTSDALQAQPGGQAPLIN